MEYISVMQAAKQWHLSDRRVRILCQQGKIPGVMKKGKAYNIPQDALKPTDGRRLKHKVVSKQFAAQFMNIDLLKDQLDRIRPLSLGELQRLSEEFLIEYTYDSNAIEGNTLTLQETALVLEGITIDQKPLKDHLEAVGHKDAFLYVQDLVKHKISFSEKVIKEIHSLVLMDRPEDKGRYRRIPVRIMGAFAVPPEPLLLPELMEKLVREFPDKRLHAIENAALFHLKFEGIHPFIDGNGRTGRLLMNLYLMQNGYVPINVKFINRKIYYEAFEAYYRNNNVNNMIKIIADYEEERLKYYADALQ